VERTSRRLLLANSVPKTQHVCICPCCHTTVKVMTFLTMPLDPKTAQPALQLEIMQRIKVRGGEGGMAQVLSTLWWAWVMRTSIKDCAVGLGRNNGIDHVSPGSTQT
jgi:hypothetical protein